MKYKNGLVIGKFMPPHKGHEFLFRFAMQYCDHLTIVVDCLKDQTIDPILRKQWIEEQLAGINVTVIALSEFMPQAPSECSNFWDIWKNTLVSVAGKPDVLLASMHYGIELAQHLGCVFVPVDIARDSISISATDIRKNVFKHWHYLMDSAKAHFLKKICFIGPESTGKTTLAKNIANQLQTVYVAEYAKELIDVQNGNLYSHNMLEIGNAQIRVEKALERMTNKVMICDSDIITTMVWSKHLFNYIPSELEDIAKTHQYAMTFLFYPDTQWVSDTHRQFSNTHTNDFRLKMFYDMRTLLIKYNRPYQVIKGSFFEKEQQIINYINSMIE